MCVVLVDGGGAKAVHNFVSLKIAAISVLALILHPAWPCPFYTPTELAERPRRFRDSQCFYPPAVRLRWWDTRINDIHDFQQSFPTRSSPSASINSLRPYQKFQPHSVSHSRKTSPPGGDQERTVGEIFLKLCEPYEAKTALANSHAICAESVAWISPSDARTLFYSGAASAYSCNITYEHRSPKSMQRILHRWQESLLEQF